MKHTRKVQVSTVAAWLLGLAGAAALGVLAYFIYQGSMRYLNVPDTLYTTAKKADAVSEEGLSQLMLKLEEAAAQPFEVPVKREIPLADLNPYSTSNTDPSVLISETALEIEGNVTDPAGYVPAQQISFGKGADYTGMEGIITFRGNNFRDTAAWGYANMQQYGLEGIWSKATGGLSYHGASWTGNGWTGQPLIVRWPESVRRIMNLKDEAKQKENLTEVIYASMDGYVYFLDLETGEETRDALYLGYTFKGAGALDPRGYPILYVGAGYDSGNGTARAFVISLIDCSVLYTFGNNDPFSLRGSLSYFDSSALVDAQTDTLIYPGESGILYLIKLNTVYDEGAGTLTLDPAAPVKWRYRSVRNSVASYWLGMEDSAVIYQGFLFIADNGGNLMCLDLNTLQLVWAADILDDSNATPVLSVENGHPYLYVSTSFHYGWRSFSQADIPIWKIDAQTGETVWHTDYSCYTQEGVSGGVQSTIAVGKEELEDHIYVTVSRTGDPSYGVLSCLDAQTGEILWEHRSIYTWSSPVCVYNEDGSGAVLYCSGDGNMYLLDALTGEEKSRLSLSNGVIEASPAVFNDIAVVGTRACKIWGVWLS